MASLKDRQETSKLQNAANGIGPNFRDASTSKHYWNQPPTPITAPSNSASKSKVMGGPFSGKIFNNLHTSNNNNKSHNPAASASDILKFDRLRKPAVGSSSSSSRRQLPMNALQTANSQRGKGKPVLPAIPSEQETIYIEDDEDTGKRLPAPTNSGQSSPDPIGGMPGSYPLMPKEGRYTEKLEQKVKRRKVDTVIKVFDDVPDVQIHFKEGPRIGAMKGKEIKGEQYRNVEAVPVKPPSARAKPSGLPITDLYIGLELKTTRETTLQYYLSYERPKLRLHIKGYQTGNSNAAKSTLTIAVDRGIEKFSTTATDVKPHLLQLETLPDDRIPASSIQVAKFVPGGERGLAIITLKFDSEVSQKEHGEFITWLKSQVTEHEIAGETAAKTIWGLCENTSGIAEQISKRKKMEFLKQQRQPRTKTTKQPTRQTTRLASKVEEIVPTSDPENDAPTKTLGKRRRSPEESIVIEQPTRRSGRRSGAQESARASPLPDADEIILVYPPDSTGAVNITNGDFRRLAPGEYLNDTLIEFALKRWLNRLKETNPELAEQIHVFSSFFYKKLNNKNRQEGYESVRKWTSKFDLFAKKYIVVPINEHIHWYLAIIYLPGHILTDPPPAPPTPRPKTRLSFNVAGSSTLDTKTDDAVPAEESRPDTPETAQDSTRHSSLAADCDDDPIAITPGSPMDVDEETPGEPLVAEMSECIIVDGDPEDRASAVSASASVSKSIPPSSFYGPGPSGSIKTKRQRPNRHEPIEVDETIDVVLPDVASEQTTYIFILDSLGGQQRQAKNVLSDYLVKEAQNKKGKEPATKPNVESFNAQVPPQPNYCDCGIYLLHFVETFMSDPESYCRLIVQSKRQKKKGIVPVKQREADWNGSTISGYRARLGEDIMQLSEKWKVERDAKAEAKKTDPEVIYSSDSEVDILEVKTKSPVKKKGKRAADSSLEQTKTPAERIR